MNEFPVRTIMRRDQPVLAPETPIQIAVRTLVENNVAAAPVSNENGALVGILTQKDCFRPVLQAAYYQDWPGTVADHMSGEVLCVDPDTSLVRAAELFLTHPHRQFPVRDGDKLVGMLYRSDVLARLTATAQV